MTITDKVLVGPILGYEGNKPAGQQKTDGYLRYTVCVLLTKGSAAPTLYAHWQNSAAPISQGPRYAEETIAGTFYRFQLTVKQPVGSQGDIIKYVITIDGGNITPSSFDPGADQEFSFYVPGAKEHPKIAYGSCNGFEPGAKDMSTPIWNLLHKQQQTSLKEPAVRNPFALLLMGGDQVYADSLFDPDMHEHDPLIQLQAWLEDGPNIQPKPDLQPALAKAYLITHKTQPA